MACNLHICVLPRRALSRGYVVLNIPRRYSHVVFGVLQSGLTCLVAAAIASYPLLQDGQFLMNWLGSWVISWLTMLPVVLLAAPKLRVLAHLLTYEDT